LFKRTAGLRGSVWPVAMMRILTRLLSLAALCGYLGGAALAATICPTSFKCGFSAVGVHSVTGNSLDGIPGSAVGTLTFDANGGISASAQLNINADSAGPLFFGGGTCRVDLSGIGVLDFSLTNGLIVNFVSTDNGQELRLINATGFNGVKVAGVGLCRQQ
jgi:hypothetical protein